MPLGLLNCDCDVVRCADSRYVGAAAPSHHPAVLVPENSGEAEKLKSRLGEDVSVGPHVVKGIRRDEGGVCKAERAALDTELLYVRPMLSLKGSLLVLLLEIPIAGEA
jgi:hypothetical protein